MHDNLTQSLFTTILLKIKSKAENNNPTVLQLALILAEEWNLPHQVLSVHIVDSVAHNHFTIIMKSHQIRQLSLNTSIVQLF
jgi:hypothetical protein